MVSETSKFVLMFVHGLRQDARGDQFERVRSIPNNIERLSLPEPLKFFCPSFMELNAFIRV